MHRGWFFFHTTFFFFWRKTFSFSGKKKETEIIVSKLKVIKLKCRLHSVQNLRGAKKKEKETETSCLGAISFYLSCKTGDGTFPAKGHSSTCATGTSLGCLWVGDRPLLASWFGEQPSPQICRWSSSKALRALHQCQSPAPSPQALSSPPQEHTSAQIPPQHQKCSSQLCSKAGRSSWPNLKRTLT